MRIQSDYYVHCLGRQIREFQTQRRLASVRARDFPDSGFLVGKNSRLFTRTIVIDCNLLYGVSLFGERLLRNVPVITERVYTHGS